MYQLSCAIIHLDLHGFNPLFSPGLGFTWVFRGSTFPWKGSQVPNPAADSWPYVPGLGRPDSWAHSNV